MHTAGLLNCCAKLVKHVKLDKQGKLDKLGHGYVSVAQAYGLFAFFVETNLQLRWIQVTTMIRLRLTDRQDRLRLTRLSVCADVAGSYG